MIEVITGVIIVLFVLTLVMFLLLKKIVQEINHQSKEYFALKLQDYDDLVEEREKRLIELEKNKERIRLEEEGDSEQEAAVVCVSDKLPEYQVEGLLQKMKTIDEEFDLDNDKIVTLFLKENQSRTNEVVHQELLALKKYLGQYEIYRKISGNKQLLFDIIQRLSPVSQERINQYHLATNRFNVNDFLEYLEVEIRKSDPVIYIEVGDKDLNYDQWDARIKTVYNDKIYKGIRIRYQDKLYDYSLT
ncbi:MAG TPA: hypothetical protein IAB56_06290 [Candidatus Scybalousia intestinigallinarum]|nr:hypothetical protein [Candidatus Scybalousia intestinigallinarum]